MGFTVNPNLFKIVISYIAIALIIKLLTINGSERLSKIVNIVIVAVIYVPITTLFGFMDLSWTYLLVSSVAVIGILLLSKIKLKLIRINPTLVKISEAKVFKNRVIIKIVELNERINQAITSLFKINSQKYYTCIEWILIATLLYTVIGLTLLNIHQIDIKLLFNLKSVYAHRPLISYQFGLNYTFHWVTKVIIPFMIAYYSFNKQKLFFSVAISCQVWLFVISGHKMVLFSIVPILAILYITKVKSNKSLMFAWLITGSVVISFVLSMMGINFFVDYIIRRLFLLPALITFYYVSFFSVYGFQFWAHGLIGKIFGIASQSQLSPGNLIGKEFFGNPNNNAVANFIGTEYMNAGIIGVMISVVVIVAVLKVTNHFEDKLNFEITAIAFLLPIYSLLFASITTSLITGGVLLACLVLFSTQRNEEF